MYYDKRIRYLNYFESGIKLQNAGYVKFQVRDHACQMVISIKGPRLMGSGEAKVYFFSENHDPENGKSGLERRLLGNIGIRNGQGYCAVRLNADYMGDTGFRYDEVCGIRIELHEYQYLESEWAVVNFMPWKSVRKSLSDVGLTGIGDGLAGRGETESKAGYRTADAGEEREGSRTKDETGKGAQQREISLIVTPVSQRSRVERFTGADFAEEAAAGESSEREEETENSSAEKEPVIDKIIEEEALANRTDGEENFIIQEISNEVDKPGEPEKDIDVPRGILMEEAVILQEELQEERSGQEETDAETETVIDTEADTAEESGADKDTIEGAGLPEGVKLAEAELKPDKWEQLKKTYPVVHPIREDEEYLKIAPKDFVIFTQKYQELVHNSFLLHGYYNYKHLILGRKEKGGKTVYYLGVPGTFHEREKTVAVMFGFEAFDGKREPAENGDFGYYLKRVEL